MLLGEFKSSTAYTLGVELELQLIDLSDFNLAAASPDLIYLLDKKKFPGEFTPEVTESMIEICTYVHNDYSGVLTQLLQMRDALVTAADKLNIGICGGGTHPFQTWSEQKVSNKERFHELSARYGYLFKQLTVFGQHIHIGCTSGNSALCLLHALNRFVPHFIALSASSHFVQRNETFFNSSRLNSVFAFPLSGHAPFILDWEEFNNNYFTKMHKTGTIKSMKDFYWDIRPKPEFGTIELRVCDTPLTVTKAAVLAAYLQALCRYILEDNQCTTPAADDYLVYNYNRFQACRFGMDSTIVDPKSYAPISLRRDILQTLETIHPHAETLGSLDAMQELKTYINGDNDAMFLRDQLSRDSTMEYIVNQAINKFIE